MSPIQPWRRAPLGLEGPMNSGRMESNVYNVDSSSMGINSHSAMVENVIGSIKYIKWKKEYVPVKKFWKGFLRKINY